MLKWISIVLIVVLFGAGCGSAISPSSVSTVQPLTTQSVIAMQIQSPVFDHSQKIPNQYTCDGDDISPPLIFADVPEGAKSLVLINDDPDAEQVVGYTWVHWTLWNIPAVTREIKEGKVPLGAVEGFTSFGKSGYGGPCPPSGEHHYFFKLYALDIMLDLPPSTDAKVLEQAMEGHVLGQAELVGLYSRQ